MTKLKSPPQIVKSIPSKLSIRDITSVKNVGFSYMTDAIKSVIARTSYNSLTKKNQYPWEEYAARRESKNPRGRGRKNTTQQKPQLFNSNFVSPDKQYSEATTPSKRRPRADPALKDSSIPNEVLTQQQMLTRAASAAISS